jgi:hypothetical protein
MYAEFFREVEKLRLSALHLTSAHNVISPTVGELQKRFLPGEWSAKSLERYHGKRSEWCEPVLGAILNKEDDDRASSIMAAFWSSFLEPCYCTGALSHVMDESYPGEPLQRVFFVDCAIC